MSRADRARLRRRTIGYVFQDYLLAWPLLIGGHLAA
jgi:ABC-type lipoprotein export system ATPase subunit